MASFSVLAVTGRVKGDADDSGDEDVDEEEMMEEEEDNCPLESFSVKNWNAGEPLNPKNPLPPVPPPCTPPSLDNALEAGKVDDKKLND